jgi:hypothetical protein
VGFVVLMQKEQIFDKCCPIFILLLGHLSFKLLNIGAPSHESTGNPVISKTRCDPPFAKHFAQLDSQIIEGKKIEYENTFFTVYHCDLIPRCSFSVPVFGA